ncbi:hypothetical protein E5288_WYG001488 [Bos mutus]|uniref:DUF3496 domain-containing protein n=1 Tax=Bos mutus TaxID=72004 RepID=A0A6B0SBD7_9CETA|nr:hypothetical protein [Bos mutus]
MQKKCEKLEKNKKKLEQEVVHLRSHIEMNMIEHSQVEQYKRETEERIQAASQENLEQLQEKNNASIRSQMELSIKDLESELSKVKTLQEDSHKAELETYKQLYLVELEVRKSLEGKLDKTALHLDCANGHSAVVTLLRERKCLLNLCDNENRTTLMKDDLTSLLLAICERRGQMVEFLVKKEENIHAVDKMKRTALMLAVKYESINVVRFLLQQGADIFSQDVFGWTAEEYAVISGFNM